LSIPYNSQLMHKRTQKYLKQEHDARKDTIHNISNMLVT